MDRTRAMMILCRELFTSNLVPHDFDDVQVHEVKGDFLQQSDGAGLQICFSVSAHAIGKMGKEANDTLEVLLAEGDTSND